MTSEITARLQDALDHAIATHNAVYSGLLHSVHTVDTSTARVRRACEARRKYTEQIQQCLK